MKINTHKSDSRGKQITAVSIFDILTVFLIAMTANRMGFGRLRIINDNTVKTVTKIRYSLPQSSNVMIKVFDILGNEIETLVDEEKPVITY